MGRANQRSIGIKPLFNDSMSEWRAILQRSMLLKLSRNGNPSSSFFSLNLKILLKISSNVKLEIFSGNQVEYTEPTVLVTQTHIPQQVHHVETHHIPGVASSNTTIPSNSAHLQRCDSNNSVAADHEICSTLRHRSRTQTSEEEMADEDELLEAGKIHNNDRIMDDFEHMHLNGSLTRRRILPQAINKEQILNYIANTSSLYIRRSGTELQVTDSTGFPLLDVWQKRNCFHTTWILESYGRTVLLLHTAGRPWKLFANKMRKSLPVLEVESSDEELLGYFVVGMF